MHYVVHVAPKRDGDLFVAAVASVMSLLPGWRAQIIGDVNIDVTHTETSFVHLVRGLAGKSPAASRARAAAIRGLAGNHLLRAAQAGLGRERVTLFNVAMVDRWLEAARRKVLTDGPPLPHVISLMLMTRPQPQGLP